MQNVVYINIKCSIKIYDMHNILQYFRSCKYLRVVDYFSLHVLYSWRVLISWLKSAPVGSHFYLHTLPMRQRPYPSLFLCKYCDLACGLWEIINSTWNGFCNFCGNLYSPHPQQSLTHFSISDQQGIIWLPVCMG